MRQPRHQLYVFWLQDIGGEWIHVSETNKRDAMNRWRIAQRRGYPVTTVETFVAIRKCKVVAP